MSEPNRNFELHVRNHPEAYLNIQRRSFQTLLNVGLAEMFRPYQKIRNAISRDTQDVTTLIFHGDDYRLVRPKLTVKQCLLRRRNYSAPLYMPVEFRRDGRSTGVAWFRVMNLPLMTVSGHFIIRGIARVVLNQVVRSPGVHFQTSQPTPTATLIHADFIAQRGTWLRLEANQKELQVWAKVKYLPRLPLHSFLRCFGMPTSVLNLYLDTAVSPRSNDPVRLNALNLRGMEAHDVAPRVGSRLRRERHGSTAVGVARTTPNVRLYGDLSNVVRGFPETSPGGLGSRRAVIRDDLRTVYRRFLKRRFWTDRTYSLGSVGRWRLNRSLGLRLPLNRTTLSAIDVLFAALRLMRTANGSEPTNDVDDLRNQIVRPGVNLVQNIIAAGFVASRKAFLQNHNLIELSRGSSPTEARGVESGLRETPTTPQSRRGSTRSPQRELESKEPREKIALAQRKTGLADLHKAGSEEIDVSLNRFFGTNPLSQFLDETNPLAELTHKRRLSNLGPGGVTRATAPMAVRNIHPSHYGRICPIETPEGKNAGLVNSLTAYGQLNATGEIDSPLRRVYKGYVVWDELPRRVDPAQESRIRVASGDRLRSPVQFLSRAHDVATKLGSDYALLPRATPRWSVTHPLQMTSVATGLIPFLEHDDGNRALMGSNMQRQAIATLGACRPIVGTGGEPRAAALSAANAQAYAAGLVGYVDSHHVTIIRRGFSRGTVTPPMVRSERDGGGYVPLARTQDPSHRWSPLGPRSRQRWDAPLPPAAPPTTFGGTSGELPMTPTVRCTRGTDVAMRPRNQRIPMMPLGRSNQDTPRYQRPRVRPGQWVQRGDMIGENAGSDRGDLSVGVNLLVGYAPWEGYNFEDALLINRALADDDRLTSLHVNRYDVVIRDTPLGYDRVTRDGLPKQNRHPSWLNLDPNGIVRPGSWVEPGDTLVGRITPFSRGAEVGGSKEQDSSYRDLLNAAFRAPHHDLRETSLILPNHSAGRVIHVERVRPRFDKALALTTIPVNSLSTDRAVGRINRQRKLGRFLRRRWRRQCRYVLPFARRHSPDAARRRPVRCTSRTPQPRPRFSSRRSLSGSGGHPIPPYSPGSPRRFPRVKTRRGGLTGGSSNPIKTDWKPETTYVGRVAGLWREGHRRPTCVTVTRSRVQRSLARCLHRTRRNVRRKPPLRLRGRRSLYPTRPTLHRTKFPTLRWQSYPRRHEITPSGRDRGWVPHPVNNPRWGGRHPAPPYVGRDRSKSMVVTPVRPKAPRSYVKPYPSAAHDAPGRSSELGPRRIGGRTRAYRRRHAELPRPSSLVRGTIRTWRHSAAKVLARISVYVAHEKRIQVGDKLSGRHGNKGIISRLLSRSDMPYLPDGRPLDVVLNPLGVPSRMNVGQIFECLLGLAGAYLHQTYRLVPFDEVYGCEASRSLVYAKLYEARLRSRQDWLFDPNFPGKVRLFDGRTGRCFQQPITVGKAYILKLIHLVDEKIHSRTTGPYALITQQPLRGRVKQGGQRLGEMEVWALQGFGASYTLQEMMTFKSDDMYGRRQLMEGFHPKPAFGGRRDRQPGGAGGRESGKLDVGGPTVDGSSPATGTKSWLRRTPGDTFDYEPPGYPRRPPRGWHDPGKPPEPKPDVRAYFRKQHPGLQKPSYNLPESFRVLMYELQGLGLQVLTGYTPAQALGSPERLHVPN